MFNENRTHHLAKVENAEELARKLTSMTWTFCQGWECGGLLWLNDSISENGAREYTVIRPERDLREAGTGLIVGTEVESINFFGLSYDRARWYIAGLTAPGAKLESYGRRHCRISDVTPCRYCM